MRRRGSGKEAEVSDKRLAVFAAAYEQGSIAAAARRLGISYQGALRRMRDLEDELGGDLFVRTPWGVVPTALGQDVRAGLERRAEEEG